MSQQVCQLHLILRLEWINRQGPGNHGLSFCLSQQQDLPISNWGSGKSCKWHVYRGQVSDVNEGVGQARTKGIVHLHWTAERKPCLHVQPRGSNKKHLCMTCPPPAASTHLQLRTNGFFSRRTHGWMEMDVSPPLLSALTRIKWSYFRQWLWFSILISLLREIFFFQRNILSCGEYLSPLW